MVGTFVSGVGFPHDQQGGEDGVAFLKVSDLDPAPRFVVRAANYVSTPVLRALRAPVVPPGTLLIPKIGAAIGNCDRRVLTGVPAAFDNNVLGIVPVSIESGYLKHWLGRRDLRDLVNPGALPSLNVEALGRLEVPIEGRRAQRQIADFLDRECERLDAAFTGVQHIHRLAEAAFLTARHEVMLSAGPEVRLKFVLTALVDTAHATCPAVESGDHWVIRTTGVRNGRLHTAGCYRTSHEHFAEWTRRRVPSPGDVVLTREAPAGEAAVIPGHDSWCLGQRSVLLVVDRGQLDPSFLVHALYGPRVREEIALMSRATTTAHLNVGEIGELPIPIPSLELQRDIVGSLAAKDKSREALADQAHQLHQRLGAYRSSLIRDAVTGTLDVTRAPDAHMQERLHAATEGRLDEVTA